MSSGEAENRSKGGNGMVGTGEFGFEGDADGGQGCREDGGGERDAGNGDFMYK